MESLCFGWCLRRSYLLALLAFFVAIATSAPCDAQQGSSAAAAAPTATPKNVLDAGDVYLPGSRVYVFVGKNGFGHEHGVVGQLKQGHINLSAARDAGGVVFDMASFSADTPAARKFVGLEGTTDASTQQQVNANMHGPDVLDVAHFPTATFIIKQITKLDRLSRRNLPQYQLTGDFTLHGTTRPVQVLAEAEDKDGWTHLMGSFTMLQSQFGITPFTKAFGAIGVSDQLNVWGDLWISKQRQVAARTTVTR